MMPSPLPSSHPSRRPGAALVLLAAAVLPAPEPLQQDPLQQAPLEQALPPAAREQVRDGTFTSHYHDGGVREQGPVDATGRRDGDWVVRHANGRTAAHGRYAGGVPDGRWQQCDVFGRPVQLLFFERGTLRHRVPATMPVVPLDIDDLRLALDGEETLGARLEACRPAPDAAARQRLAEGLLPFGELAAAVVADEAERDVQPAARRAWLELLARLPLPGDLPTGSLLRWQWDPVCGAAARAVLTRWSQQSAGEWQPLVADGNTDPERFLRLQRLGARAYGALPALQRALAARQPASSSIAHIAGGLPAGVRPRLLALLEGDDGELRLCALAVWHAHRYTLAPPAATLLRLIDDADPTIASLAASLLAARIALASAAFDDRLDGLWGHAVPLVRASAARRLVQLGRTAAALPLLRELVREPQPEVFGDAPLELARHSDRREADRELLLDAAQQADRYDLHPAIAGIADGDVRAADLLVERRLSPRPYGVRLAQLPRPLWPRAQERLRAALASGDAAVRANAHAGLWELAAGDAEQRQLVRLGLADPADAVRRRLVHCLRLRPFVPLGLETLLALLRDEATRGTALELLARQPLPDGFDPRRLPMPAHFANGVPATVLAAWADGHVDRVGVLVDFALAPGSPWQAVPALQLLQADLRPFAERIREALLRQAAEERPSAHAGWLLQQLPPATARSTWVRCVLLTMSRPRRMSELICDWPSRGDTPPSLDRPLAAEDVPCIVASFADPDPAVAAAAVRLLAHCGALAAGSVDALVAALPALPPEALRHVPATLLAIAPERATAISAPLLAHADANVRQQALDPAARGDGAASLAGSLPVDAAFARRLVAALLAAGDGASSRWFDLFADRGRSVLPELAEALRRRPGHLGIAAALCGLGPAAAVARDELLLAAAAENGAALQAAARALPRDEALRELLLGRLRSGRASGAMQAAVLVEAFPDDAEVARALREAVESGTEAQAGAAIAALAQSGRSDDGTIATLLAAVRRSPDSGYPGSAPLADEAVLALLPQLGAAARERLLVHHLQLLAGRSPPATLHPRLLEKAVDLLPLARDRFALLVGLAMLAPGHPLLAGREQYAQRSWNRLAGGPVLLPRSTPASRVRHRVLLDAAQEPHEQFVQALRADPAAALAAIRPHLGSPAPHHRTVALGLLWELGEAARPAFADATALLADGDPQVRAAAVSALVAARPDDAAATAALLAADADLPAHQRPWVPALERLPAPIARALLEQAPIDLDAAPYLLPAVLAVLGPDDARLQRLRQGLREPWVDERMLEAVRACGGRGVELLPELRALLRDGGRRVQAIALIGGLGPAAAPAAADLRALLPIPECRFAAREALRRLE